MKIALAAAGLLTGAVLTACGGSPGHSDAYKKGYQWATDNQFMVAIQVGAEGLDQTCQSHAGLNNQEWIQGCKDGLTKVLSTTGGKSTVDHAAAEKFITDQVAQGGFPPPSDVSCPSGVEAKVGVEFDCHFTGVDGPYTAHMKIQKIESDGITYEYETHRS